MMEERLKLRLESLKNEYQTGQNVLMELDGKITNTRETLLRISGAIQVLEEELAELKKQPQNPSDGIRTDDT